MKSAEASLIDFLRSNPSKWASGALQRMKWCNRNGTLATPRSIVRRLEENVENGILEVSYENGNAFYQVKEEHRKKIHSFEPVIVDGIRMMKEIITTV